MACAEVLCAWVGWTSGNGTWCAAACGVVAGSRCRCGAVGCLWRRAVCGCLPAMRLPALESGRGSGRAIVGRARDDRHGWRFPTCPVWLRWTMTGWSSRGCDSLTREPITCELCGGRTGRWAPSLTLGSATSPYWIQERRVAPLGADRCVLLERQGGPAGGVPPGMRGWTGSDAGRCDGAGRPVRSRRRTSTVWTMGCMS